MRVRNKVLTSLLFFVFMLFGAWIFLDRTTTNIVPTLNRVPATEILRSTKHTQDDFFSFVSHQSLYYWNVLKESNGLLFYGALGLFGIMMMVLIIGSAASAPKDTTQAMLELLKQEKERAENLAKLKSEFLNQVSHELRTPLAVIIGYLECMTDGLYGQIEAKHQEILQAVSKQSNHLKNMIDQILIFSRLEANRQPLRVQEFSIQAIISDLRETFEFLCQQKGIGLTWDVPVRVASLESDADRVKEILSNLLQNAVKYTDRGSITVKVRQQPDMDSMLLEVSDTGMGIPEPYLATIFEPFTQVHKTSSENARGGIGLGLSIVKKHVEHIKGTITVASQLGKGSAFRIVLPRIYDVVGPRHMKLLRVLRFLRHQGKSRPIVRAKEARNPQTIGRMTRAHGSVE